jgi:hypothetical protein
MQPIDVSWRRTNGQKGSNRRRFPANWGRSAQWDDRHTRWLLEGWWHITSIARFAERKTRPASRGSA